MSVVGTIFAAVFLKDPLTRRKLLGIGIGIVIVGLLTLSGVSSASLTGRAGIGDVLFIAAGSLWAGFGVVMRKFRLDPVLATTAAGVFGLVTYVPFYLATEGIGRLASADGSLLGIEVLVQGVLGRRGHHLYLCESGAIPGCCQSGRLSSIGTWSCHVDGLAGAWAHSYLHGSDRLDSCHRWSACYRDSRSASR